MNRSRCGGVISTHMVAALATAVGLLTGSDLILRHELVLVTKCATDGFRAIAPIRTAVQGNQRQERVGREKIPERETVGITGF